MTPNFIVTEAVIPFSSIVSVFAGLISETLSTFMAASSHLWKVTKNE